VIALFPVPWGVEAVRADRIVCVRRQKETLVVWVDNVTSLESYEVKASEDAIRVAWDEYLEHHDTAGYEWDLTWLALVPAPVDAATGT